LQQYIKDAVNGDGADGELIWQTVLHQSFDMIREIYLRLSLEERERFDKNYTSVFFTHAATQPIYNAEKILALMKSGFVDVIKLGSKYQMKKNDNKDVYEFIYKGISGVEQRDVYRYVVNARGQAVSIETDPSDLMRNLLRRGIVQIEETQEIKLKENDSEVPARHSNKQTYTYKTGSIWIDPQTHQVVRTASSVKGTKSKRIYAVGAMTRGQIIDASMAHGIVQSTACIADIMINDLKGIT
jgi:hypothetical protein